METPAILKRAAEKGNFLRVRFQEKDIPSSMSDIFVMLFFGDMRSTFLASSLLMRRYREEAKGSKYFILCSWPGYESLFPYVDEYWTIKSESLLKELLLASEGFKNDSTFNFRRSLNYFFENVEGGEVLDVFYSNGLTQEFFDRFREVRRFLPEIPSPSILGNLNQKMGAVENKVFIYPALYIRQWQYGRIRMTSTPKEFWVELSRKLIEKGMVPVLYQNFFAHDLSAILTDGCIHFREKNISKVMAAMRMSDCVLDIFSDISRFALAARCPFLACDERGRYADLKEFEIDALCSGNFPTGYIFSFPTIIEKGEMNLWGVNLLDNITARLSSFLPKLDRNDLPSAFESYETIPYDGVKKTKAKRLGTRFVKVDK